MNTEAEYKPLLPAMASSKLQKKKNKQKEKKGTREKQ